MTHTKYIYYKVIQGRYGDSWEDVDFHEADSTGYPKNRKEFLGNLKAYREAEPRPFRTIVRREIASRLRSN